MGFLCGSWISPEHSVRAPRGKKRQVFFGLPTISLLSHSVVKLSPSGKPSCRRWGVIPQWEELLRTRTCPNPQHGFIYKLRVYSSTSEATQGMEEEESQLLTACSEHLLAYPISLHSRSRSSKNTSSCPLLSSHCMPVTILSTYIYHRLDPHHNPVGGIIMIIISILQKRKLSHMKVNSPV